MAEVNEATGTSYLADDRAARFAAAETALIKALSLAPQHARAHWLLGRVKMFTNRAAQGIADCEQALALDRNLAGAHGEIGHAKYFLGRGAETEAHVQEALRLSPRDTDVFVWMMVAGLAKLQIGADEEAVARFRRSVENNRNHPRSHFFLAAALAHLGRLDEARSRSKRGLRSIQVSLSAASAPAHWVTIRPTSLGARIPVRACAWPGCRRGKRPTIRSCLFRVKTRRNPVEQIWSALAQRADFRPPRRNFANGATIRLLVEAHPYADPRGRERKTRTGSV
ncbi:tetratricopeptide (TPR) repeat protein [Bradyrhizobium sp. CIR18]|nr:tetratricopeptide (TPR) repeat protein [Bradyrhizobium sp. CIR18]